MAENKNSFLIDKKWNIEISKLSDNDSGKLIKAIFSFVNDKEPEINENIEGLFIAITEQIVFEWSKFNPKTNKYHWNYQGGISAENHIIRNSTEIKIWRTKVFERDNYTCQNCGEKGGELNAHHIKMFSQFPKLRFDVSNGLTLCKQCHINIHKNHRNERI